MEGKKEAGSSSFSFNELFGPKDPPAPKGYFESILGPPPPSKVPRRESLHAEDKGQDSANDAGNKKPGHGNSESGEGNNTKSRDSFSTFERQYGNPCNLSSSIYYGGPDIISHPSNSKAFESNSKYNTSGQDDSGAATRGNWWQGSLFY